MIFGLIFLMKMPESPRFLISVKRFKEAREVFAWIGKVNGLSDQTIKQRLSEIIFEGESGTRAIVKVLESHPEIEDIEPILPANNDAYNLDLDNRENNK